MQANAFENTQTIPQKCAKCGLTSSVKEAFIVKKSIFGARKTICFECQQKGTMNTMVIQIGLFLALAVLFSWFAPGSAFSQLFGLCLAAFVIEVPFIVLHELAHAGVGWLFDFRVFSIHIGMGKIVYSTRIRGVQWVWHLLPFGGLTMIATSNLAHYRLRRFFMVLAGPAVHAVVVVCMFALAPILITHDTDSILSGLYYMTIALNIAALLLSLFPHKSVTALGNSGSDGLLLLQLPGMGDKELRLHYASYYVLEALDAIDLNNYPAARQWAEQGLVLYPENSTLLNACGVIYNYSNEHEKARQTYLRVLEANDLTGELKYIAMNNVAYANLMLEDSSLLGEADEYSAQAVKNVPWHPALIGTRGSVLVELGQVEAGLELLKTALKKSPHKRNKAENACGIALGELKRGRPIQAERYLEAARRFDPHCVLLERVTRKIHAESPLHSAV